MRWDYLTEAERESRLASWEQLATMFPTPNPWQRRGTDAGIALFDAATADDRLGDIASRLDKAREAVDADGVWVDQWEWRIGTDGTERIERINGGFRASAHFNGRFRVDVQTFGEAWEARAVLKDLGIALFYALGWTEHEMTPSLESEPDRSMTEAYAKRLARETLTLPASTAEPGTMIVSRDSLVLECDCTTPERASLFLGVFDAMATDLLEILEWKPLPALR